MTTLSKEQEAVLTAITLKGQVETLKVKVDEADKASTDAVAKAATQRDAAVARGRTAFENEQKQATEVYARQVAESMKEPVAVRATLEQAEVALKEHLEKMQKSFGIRMDWLNPAPRGGKVNL